MTVTKRPPARWWIPPHKTVEAVAAGQFWDAVAVPQHIGLAALEWLDETTAHRPGPIIWDTSSRPRLYFLIPVGADQSWQHERLLTTGSYVAVPGPTTLEPPGPYWIAPPDPDEPDALVDAGMLRRALDRVRTAAVAEYHPRNGAAQRMLVTVAQMQASACIVCGLEGQTLVEAGHAMTPPLGPGQLVWAVAACPEHAGESS